MEKKPTITPRGKYVLVKPDAEASRISDHGIVTPENEEKETKAFGVVEAIGPDIVDIKKEDRVIYGKFAGEEISFEDNPEKVDFVLLFEEDILAFIE